MIRTLKISAAVAIAGAFSVAQAAKCATDVTDKTFGPISFKEAKVSNKDLCIAVIDADGDNHNVAVDVPETITVDSIYYFRRNSASSAIQTVILPFEPVNSCKPTTKGGTLYTLNKIYVNQNDNWTALIFPVVTSTAGFLPNTPYFVRFSEKNTDGLYLTMGGCSFNLNTSNGAGVVEYSADPDPKASTGLTGTWELRGVYEKKTWTSDDAERKVSYGFASTKTIVEKTDGTKDTIKTGQFVKAGSSASVPPLRAYLVYNSQDDSQDNSQDNSQSNSQSNSPKVAAKARAISSAEEIDESVLLPQSIDIVMMSAEDPEGDAPATEECFQDGDGIFEVKDIHLKNETGTPVLNDEGNPIYDTDGNQVLSYDDIIVRTACIDGKSDARMQTLSISQNIEVDSIAYNRTFAIGSGWNNPAVASTIVLPFTVSENQCISNAVFYDILNIRNWGQEDNLTWQIMVEQRDNSKPLIPNHPYIVLANDTNIIFNRAISGGFKKCAYNITYSNVLEDTVFSNVDGLPGTWTFKGTYEKITFNESSKRGVYGFVAKQDTVDGKVFSAGQFVKAGTGASVPPMRAYLKYNAAGALAKGAASTGIAEEDLPETIVVKFLNTDGEVTAIGQMNTTTGEISMDENKWFDMKGRMMNKKPTVKGTYYNKGQKVIIK